MHRIITDFYTELLCIILKAGGKKSAGIMSPAPKQKCYRIWDYDLNSGMKAKTCL